MASKCCQVLWRHVKAPPFRSPPVLATHRSGGSNLEVFKFGMYIMFPIGWMYYFGTNLESRFSVPDFWPEPGTTHRIPFEKEELDQLAEQLKAQRLEKRRRRLERVRAEMKADGVEETRQIDGKVEEVEQKKQVAVSEGTFGVGAIEKWAGGK